LVLANKEVNQRKISNSFIVEKNDASPIQSKEKQILNINNNINIQKKNSKNSNNNSYLNVNNLNNLHANYHNNNKDKNIKNIQINFNKDSTEFNYKNTQIITKGTHTDNNNKLANNNNKNYMELIEKKQNTGSKAKNINQSHVNPKEEILNSIEKINRSSSKKNKSKTKFKSNNKLENHLGNVTKTFYGNNNLNEKYEFASSSSGFSNFFAKNKGHSNTKSEFDITKNFNITLKNNEQMTKSIKIINNKNNNDSKNQLNMHFIEKQVCNEIDYLNIKCPANKENDECNISKKSSSLANGKNKTSINLRITDKVNKLGSNNNNTNINNKNLDKDKHLPNVGVLSDNNFYGGNKRKNNYLNNNLNQSAGKSKKNQRISIYSNENSRNNSFDNISGTKKIEEKIINTNRVFSANTRLDDLKNDNLYKIYQANFFEKNPKKENSTNKKNLIFINDKRNSSNFINNQTGILKNKMSVNNESIIDIISNNFAKNHSSSLNLNNNLSNNNNNEVKKNHSNVNENIFLEKIKQKNKNLEISENVKTITEKKNKKNLSTAGVFNNSNSNLKFNVNTQETSRKMENRIASPINKIDIKKLKIMIINNETNNINDGNNQKMGWNKLNILGTNSNCDETNEEAKMVKFSLASYNNPVNLNLPEIKNIRIENFSKNIEFDNSNIKPNNKKYNDININNNNINKTYSTLAKKLKKNKDAKNILECSSSSNFEIISCKPDKKSDEEIIINRNKSYDISKNLGNKAKGSQSNSNSNNEENLNNYYNEVVIKNFNIENELNRENLNICSNSKSRKNFISKNNIYNSVSEANFNTKTTKDTLKLSYYQNKNFSHIEIEGPEELHMLYINLNQQNKKLIYKFDKIDDTIKANQDNTFTVHHYDNEIEI
jgi:hypothetical protein